MRLLESTVRLMLKARGKASCLKQHIRNQRMTHLGCPPQLLSCLLVQTHNTHRMPSSVFASCFNSMVPALASKSGLQLMLADSFYKGQPLLATLCE